MKSFMFGTFRFIPKERVLLDEGRPLRVGARAIEILHVLLKAAGTTVRKKDLIDSTWPDVVVDEAALRVHIAALRKTLGDGRSGNRFIVNVPGQGYSFVAPVIREPSEWTAESANTGWRGGNLPASISRIIGRDAVIAALVDQLHRSRLLSIVGPGGVGKTTVALAAAAAVTPSYPDGSWFVGLTSLTSPELVPTVLGTAFGISVAGADAEARLVAWLREKTALIVLDNCEHLIEAVAAVTDRILRSAPGISILTTSREALRIEAEQQYRLAPLDLPPKSIRLSPDEVLTYPAVMLFSERAAATAGTAFQITNSDVPAIVEICHQVDGIPLALELAAARVSAFGIRDLARQLQERVALLMTGRRTAMPRHQTLSATLDWSYALLPEREQSLLRRLAVFQGQFSVDAVIAMAGDTGVSSADVLNDFAGLVDKSLVSADTRCEVTHYILLETTKKYAMGLLKDCGGFDAAMRLLCHYLCRLFSSASDDTEQASDHLQADRRGYIDSLRTALAWCFSPGGDFVQGIRLAVAATDFWLAMSLLSECCDWGLKAVHHLASANNTVDEMILQCGLGQALTYSRGMQQQARAALTRAWELAVSLNDSKYQFRSVYALWLFALRAVDFPECLEQSRRCAALAQSTGDLTATATANFMFGQTHYYLGNHAEAVAELHLARDLHSTTTRSGDLVLYGADLLTASLSYTAAASWSLGFADQALKFSGAAIHEAHIVDNPASLCIALNMCSAVFLIRMGRLEDAEHCIEELLDHSAKHSLHPYHAVGVCSKGVLAAAHGDFATGERLLRAGLQQAAEVGYYLFHANFRGELAAVLGSLGRVDEGLAEIDQANDYAKATKSLWCIPELLRIKGELLIATGAWSEAERCLTQARDLASEQGALAWELRAARSLANLLRDRGKFDLARQLLSSVTGKFAEGADTTDLRAAREFLVELS